MFKTIEALTPAKHKDLRLSKATSFAFANKISSVNLSYSEFRQAGRHYPIVFFESAPCIPQALLSLEPEKNTCMDEKGNWKAPYVPAYFRFYPFTLAQIQDQADKLILCIDPEAEHFKSGMGEPMFTADGELTEFVQNILKALEGYQKEIKITQTLFTALDDQGVMVDKSFKYHVNQEEKSIKGFKGVDMEKLMTLDDKSLAGYVKNGTMGMIYEHTHSLSNFSKFLAPATTSGTLN